MASYGIRTAQLTFRATMCPYNLLIPAQWIQFERAEGFLHLVQTCYVGRHLSWRWCHWERYWLSHQVIWPADTHRAWLGDLIRTNATWLFSFVLFVWGTNVRMHHGFVDGDSMSWLKRHLTAGTDRDLRPHTLHDSAGTTACMSLLECYI